MLMKRCFQIAVCGLVACLVMPAAADVVGRAISPDGDLNSSFAQTDPDYDLPGDMFGIRSRLNPDPPDTITFAGLPFAIADDTLTFEGDELGVIGTNDEDDFFGVVDTVNDTGSNTNVASWTFDISSVTSNLIVSVDMAAMGDFEDGADFYDFTYSIDESTAAPLFTTVIDEDGMQSYTMENGSIVDLNDPALMNILDATEDSILLNNTFQTLAAALPGTGSTLEITFSAETNGSEGFAFRNLLIEGDTGGNGDRPGDFDKDGDIDGDDFLVWQGAFGTTSGATSNSGDTDNDGDVDGDDFLVWQSGFGTQAGGGSASVPEPASAVLLVLAGLAWSATRRSR